MVERFDAEIIARETVKPSTPTPQHLGTYKLSFLDQVSPAIYVPVLLFYSTHQDNKILDLNKAQRLKSSLSQILTHFYPFAGKLKDNAVIECNDDGVDFIEARVNCSLSTIFEQPETDQLNHLLPVAMGSPLAATGPLLLAQFNSFDCGGTAIGVCISHKIADISTINSFIKAWSATALRSMSDALLPNYITGSLYPSPDFPITLPSLKLNHSKCVMKRYVFYGSKIDDLKAKVGSEDAKQPTRVEAVVALVLKCLMKASRTKLGYGRPSLVCQVVNMRKRSEPAMPENSFGNFAGHFMVKVEQSTTDEAELKELVVKLRKGLEDYTVNVKKFVQGNVFLAMCEGGQEFKRNMGNDAQDFYNCSSWCRVSQFYEADFGWGKPKWVTALLKLNNIIILMDARDGKGIEMYLCLSEEDTALVENDEELLEFASLNPSII